MLLSPVVVCDFIVLGFIILKIALNLVFLLFSLIRSQLSFLQQLDIVLINFVGSQHKVILQSVLSLIRSFPENLFLFRLLDILKVINYLIFNGILAFLNFQVLIFQFLLVLFFVNFFKESLLGLVDVRVLVFQLRVGRQKSPDFFFISQNCFLVFDLHIRIAELVSIHLSEFLFLLPSFLVLMFLS